MGYKWHQKIMKKLMYSLSVIFLLVGMTTMMSCKPEKKIIGKWKVTYSKGMDDEAVKGSVWTFKDNGKFVGNVFGADEEVACNYSFDKKTLTLSGGDLEYNDYDYKESYTITLDVDNLSKKTMSLSGRCVDKYYDKEDGYSDTETWNVSFELEKKS